LRATVARSIVQPVESYNASVILPAPVHDALLRNARENDRTFSREVRRACVFYLRHIDEVQRHGTQTAAERIAAKT
jgi:hypothetical protein